MYTIFILYEMLSKQKVALWKVEDQCLPRSTGREKKLSTKEHRELFGLTEVLYDLDVVGYTAQCLPKPVEINTRKKCILIYLNYDTFNKYNFKRM